MAGDEPGEGKAPAAHSRRRRTSRHLLLSLGAVIVFGVAIGALALSEGGVPAPTPSPSASPTGTDSPSPSPSVDTRQPTVLMQASGDGGAEVNLLTALSPEATPSALTFWMPPELVVSAPGADSQSIRATVSSIDTLRAPLAVSATIGVRIDGSWRLERKALAGLVDAAGGVNLEVSEPVKVRDGEGEVVLSLQAGPNQLTGAEAAWYAVGTVRGETAENERARGLVVFQQALAALPQSVPNVRETLTSLGALAPTTIGAQTLAEYLVDFGSALRAGRSTTYTLPTTEIALGQTPFQWTNFEEATPLLRRTLPLAQWNAMREQQPRVLVMSGLQSPGLIGSTRVPIEGLGYVFVDGRGTAALERAKSRVLARGDQPWAANVAAALDIPESAVKSVEADGAPPSGRPWADIDVTLGEDYRP